MIRALYNENDAHAAQWLRNLISRGLIAPGDVNESSIVDLRPSDIAGYTQVHFFAGIGVWSYAARLAGWSDDRPLWTASCPCQPFSAAGKGAGFADERHLWPALDWLVDQCRPETVVGEQVASKDGLAWIDLVQADVEGKGYAFGSLDSCAAGFGAPHIRQRQYWMAHAQGVGRAGRSHDRDGWRGQLSSGQGRSSDGVAHATSARRREGKHIPSGCGSSAPNMAVRAGGIERVDDTTSARQHGPLARAKGSSRNETRLRLPGEGCGHDHLGHGGRPGPTNGFWRDADWLFCTDGKWRPVEPGTFPLVDGSAFRLGSGSAFEGRSRAKMLKGYGNAINAEHAADFIRAVMSVCADGARTAA